MHVFISPYPWAGEITFLSATCPGRLSLSPYHLEEELFLKHTFSCLLVPPCCNLYRVCFLVGWPVHAKLSCSVMSNSLWLCIVALQTPLSMKFSRQESWSRLPFSSPGNLPDPGIEPSPLASPTWQVGVLPLVSPGKPYIYSEKSLFRSNSWVCCCCPNCHLSE